jgi:hypothetical protein
MAIDNIINSDVVDSPSLDTSRRLKFVALAVPTLALVGSATVITREPRFGLFATALILGWTQLVGL